MSEIAPMIHVIDDDESVRKAVTRLLKAAGYEARSYASAGEFLLADPRPGPGCIVLDVRMPGPSGLELQAALSKRRDPWPLIFLTGHGDIPMSVQAMKAGAVDFLTKPVQRQALLSAVTNALDIQREKESLIRKEEGLRVCFESLTDRERRIMELVVEGKLNKQIAATLGIAERTVKAHRAQVMEKMKVETLADLVKVAGRLEDFGRPQ